MAISSSTTNSSPLEQNVVSRLQALFSTVMRDQIPLERLTLKDIVLWHHVFVTAFIFVTGNMLYLLLQVFEFSVVTLVSRVILLQIAVFFIYHMVQRFARGSSSSTTANSNINSNETSPDLTRFMLTQERVQPYVNMVIERLNTAFRFYLEILQCQKYPTTILFCFVALCFDVLGSLLSGLNLIFIGMCEEAVWVCSLFVRSDGDSEHHRYKSSFITAFWILFTVPVFYVWQQIRIDDIVAMIVINFRFGCKALCDRFPVLRNVVSESMLPTPQRASPRAASQQHASHHHKRKKHD